MELKKSIDSLLELEPFELSKELKSKTILDLAKLQVEYHSKHCEEYGMWLKRKGFSPDNIKKIDDIPFLPSSIFKHVALSSNPVSQKIIRSSGTSSQLKSSINLDSSTSVNQTKALTKILKSFIGKNKKPFFIVDIEPKEALSDDGSISARLAGMQGYLLASKSRTYLLDQDEEGSLKINNDALSLLLETSSKEAVVVIGYTYMIWQYLAGNNNFKAQNLGRDSHLIHFGGWKKLQNLKKSKTELNAALKLKLNISEDNIMDIYGFTEQLGTVYVGKGEEGSLVSDYSHVIVRDTNTLKVLEDGEIGFLQFFSALPMSYPGFSILNDDLGYISERYNEGNREVLKFKVLSRLEKAEERGCGDTLPDNYYI